MNETLKAELRALVDRLWHLSIELDQVNDWDNPRALGQPATPSQIELVEKVAGFPLPPDYRAFLQLHNGWEGFNGENALMSAEEMSHGPFASSVAETKDIQREISDSGADGFVFNASVSGSDIAYMDLAAVHPDGTADVVRWDPRMREYKRYPSFKAYLAGQADLTETLIAEARGKLR